MTTPGGAALLRSSSHLGDPDSEVDSCDGSEADPDAANGRHRMKSIKGKLLSWVTAMAAVALTAAPGAHWRQPRSCGHELDPGLSRAN